MSKVLSWTLLGLAGMVLSAPSPATASEPLASQYSPDLSSNYQYTNDCRTAISLNGVWKIALQETPTADLPKHGYGYVGVPSSWMHTTDFPIEGLDQFEAGRFNGTGKWCGKPLSQFTSAWYVRQFTPPQSWAGGRITLQLQRLTVSGEIFLNGRSIGRQEEWDPPVEHDITALVKFDQPNELAVRVDAGLTGEVTLYLGGGDATMIRSAKAALRGVTQDVWLRKYAPGPRIEDVAVVTSVREHRIQLDARIATPTADRQQAVLHAVIRDSAGKVVKQFDSPAFTLDEPSRTVSMSEPWPDAQLWDIGEPNLYSISLALSVEQTTVDRTFPMTFGFREVWIDGRDVILNGHPIHLIQACLTRDGLVDSARHNVERVIQLHRQAGYNSIDVAGQRISIHGAAAQAYDDLLSITDQAGLAVSMSVLAAYAVDWQSPQGREQWEKAVRYFMGRYRHHPSILFWALNFNMGGYPRDMSPYAWAQGYAPPDSVLDLGRKRKMADESEDFVRQLDPSRVVFHHAGGNVGSIMTSNLYLSWPPLQEREDYPSGWSRTGPKPLMAVELGMPNAMDLLRGRNHDYEAVRWTEPLEAEYAAMYLGAPAYHMQDDQYLKIVIDNATDQSQMGVDKYNVNQPYFWRYNRALHEPHDALMKKIVPAYIPGWRAYGVTGICPWFDRREIIGYQYEPWDGVAGTYSYPDLTAPGAKPLTYFIPDAKNAPSDLAKGFAQYYRPILIFVGGGETEGFTAKDHAYFAGDQVAKQVVVVNDSTTDLRRRVTWQLLDPQAQVVASGAVEVFAPAGRTGYAPFQFVAPQVADRTEMTLRLMVPSLAAEQSTVRGMPIQIYQPSRADFRNQLPVHLIDPQGQTRRMLARMRIPFTESANGSGVQSEKVLVIGRGAFDDRFVLSPEVGKAVVRGATLVVFEQATLRAFGLRVHPRGVRQVFPLMGDHPIVAGLAMEDLENWRGDSSLLEPYPGDIGGDAIAPVEPWRWGNRGTVTSHMIEKPNCGASWPLLECEFDLGYTPLLESRQDAGRILFCQLQVTQRYGVDPIATEIVDRLLKYAQSSVPARRNVAVLGDEAFGSWARELGVRSDPASAGVYLVGRSLQEAERQAVADAVKAGAVAILVGKDATSDLSWLPGAVTATATEYFRVLPVAVPESMQAMRGVSTADLFIKDRRQDDLPQGARVQPLTHPAMIARVAHGTGAFIVMKIDPGEFRHVKVSPERKTRTYLKLGRVLSLLIANAGGDLKGLPLSTDTGVSEVALPDVWRFQSDPKNIGVNEGWYQSDYDDASWRTLKVPGYWEDQGVTDVNAAALDAKRPYDGYAWYRCAVEIPAAMEGKPLVMELGAVDDMDVTYLNGAEIGKTTSSTPGHWQTPRQYPVPAGVVKFGGLNRLAVRVFDQKGNGGMTGPAPRITVRYAESYPYLQPDPLFNPYRLIRW
jgi:beta-galactosidase